MISEYERSKMRQALRYLRRTDECSASKSGRQLERKYIGGAIDLLREILGMDELAVERDYQEEGVPDL